MAGAGNRFVVLDALRRPAPADDDLPELARRLCAGERPADGLLLVTALLVKGDDAAAARMRTFNADGSEAGMCGNGLRCVAKLLADRGHAPRGTFVVATAAGPRRVEVLESDGPRSVVRTSLGVPAFDPARIPTTLPGRPPIEAALHVAGKDVRVTCLSMGNPHAVLFVPGVATAAVRTLGPAVENHAAFPERANVGFAEVVSRAELRLRVWERGVGETAACGTGAAAAVVAGVLTGRLDRAVTVRLPGGDLRVEWPGDGQEVTLTGEATVEE